MTFLKGETTWGASGQTLIDKIIDLATGAAADSSGNTVAAASQWRRPFAGLPILAAPREQDAVITQEHRSGYWTRWDDSVLVNDKTFGALQFMQQISCWTNWHANFGEVLQINAQVITPNGTAGNYTGAQVRLRAQGQTVAGGQTNLSSGAVITLDANGVGTWQYAAGYSMSFKVQNPGDGILKSGVYYVRLYTNPFRGGIDSWRDFGRTLEAPTFTTAPDGVAGTDWQPVGNEVHDGAWAPTYAVWNTSASYWETPGNSYLQYMDAWGLGIKTDLALTGQRYEVTFRRVDAVVRFYMSTTNYIATQWGTTGLASDGTTRRYGVNGEAYSGQFFLRPFTGTPLATSRIQYWISVTDEHLSIALNGDSAQAGVTTHNMIAKVAVDDPDNDTGCWMQGVLGDGRLWLRMGSHSLIEYLSSQDNLLDGGRDWQTGYGRQDYHQFGDASWWDGGLGHTYGTRTRTQCRIYARDWGTQSGYDSYYQFAPTIDRVTAPMLADPRWYLLAFTLADDALKTSESAPVQTQYRPRGYVDHGFWIVQRGGWNDGDELLDPSTGDRWMLFAANAQSGLVNSTVALAQEQV